MDSSSYPVALSVVVSYLVAEALVLTADRHGRFTMDLPGAVQSFHSEPTPRVGGIGIYLALLISWMLASGSGRSILEVILLAGLPALAIGLLEDVTQRVGVAPRLFATMASGALACWLSGLSLTRLDIPVVDALLTFAPVALLFTAFAVAGVANAINIIDGFHGLASGTAFIASLALASIAALAGDTALLTATVVLAAAVAGFWLVNFPWGKLFLGDGGAYFVGFALAWLAVLLPLRNPGVSPWASLLVCAYPVIEVIYSIARRRSRRRSPGDADRAHLHSLVAVHVVQQRLPRLNPNLQNSAVSVVMWVCAAMPAAAAVAFHDRTGWLAACAAAALCAYHFAYRRLARR